MRNIVLYISKMCYKNSRGETELLHLLKRFGPFHITDLVGQAYGLFMVVKEYYVKSIFGDFPACPSLTHVGRPTYITGNGCCLESRNS
jgi:hypothetical protein